MRRLEATREQKRWVEKRGGHKRRGRERRREEEDRETFGGTDLGILREERHRSFPILFNALRKYPHCFERLAFSNLV